MAKTKSISTLPHVVAAALSGAVKDTVVKQAKATLPQGKTYEGEVTVRIPYRVTKGENYDTKPTVNLLSLAVLGKAAVYCGVTEAALEKALLEAATKALSNDTETVAETLTDADQRITAMVERIQANVLARLPRQPRNGVVNVTVLTDDNQPEIVKSTYVEV